MGAGVDVNAEARSARAEVRRSALLAAAAFAVVVGVLASSQGGPAYFLGLGDRSTSLELAHEVLGQDVPTPLADGHDGENFWLLARDPVLSGDGLAEWFDRPVYRAQRIGYPLLAAPWRLAGEQALLWGLVVTNVLAVAVGTWAAGSLVADRGGPPLGGYVYAGNPLVWFAVLFDLSDAVALAGLVGVVLALRRGRVGWASAGAVVAALAKESSCLGIGAIALLGRGLTVRDRVLVAGPAALSVIGWRLYVMAQPGFGTDAQVQEFVAVPFAGYVDAWRTAWSPDGQWLNAAVAIALVPVAVAVAIAWWRRRESVELSAALPYALFVPFLSVQVLDIAISSLRAIGPSLTLGAMAFVATRLRTPATSALQAP